MVKILYGVIEGYREGKRVGRYYFSQKEGGIQPLERPTPTELGEDLFYDVGINDEMIPIKTIIERRNTSQQYFVLKRALNQGELEKMLISMSKRVAGR